MEGLAWLGIIVLVILILKANKPYNEEELKRQQQAALNIVCPHCHEKGMVKTEKIKKKVGISGGKAVGAIFTCGISMLATGLSRKDLVTQAHCNNCGSTWYF